jgi:hypothetical protein
MLVYMQTNSTVYVTCRCLLNAHLSLRRKRGGKSPFRRRLKEFGSLGEFSVGTEAGLLRAAYDTHLQEAQDE